MKLLVSFYVVFWILCLVIVTFDSIGRFFFSYWEEESLLLQLYNEPFFVKVFTGIVLVVTILVIRREKRK